MPTAIPGILRGRSSFAFLYQRLIPTTHTPPHPHPETWRT